jgi:RNA polymerase sigma factor (sigma-70 family)
MMTTETQELLANFVKTGSELAFRELVTRYFDLVYSTALRLVDGDAHRGQDVSQIVFADLARMAGKLPASTALGGWLHRHTCFVARNIMRGERRRQARERQATEMNALNDQLGSVFAQVAPFLDEAIDELGPDDRDVILLRFFECRKLRAVGEALGTTENVAQKRVSRAVNELGALLQRRGVTLSATALASSLAAGAVTAAPAGLASSIAGAVLTGAGTTGGIGLVSGKVIAVVKLKGLIVGAIVVAGIVATILLQTQSTSSSRNDQGLERQKAALAEAGNIRTPEPAGQEKGRSSSNSPLVRARDLNAEPLQVPTSNPVGQPPLPSAGVVGRTAVDEPFLPLQRFASRSGSRIRIEGTSNIHDWQVEGSVIGGFLEVGAGFPVEQGQDLGLGPVEARAEAFIPVRSLKSVEKDGRPYSDKMDEIMYESLKVQQDPRLTFSLRAMSLKGITNKYDALQYEYEAHGELVVAGLTNRVVMPVSVLPMGGGRLKISGETGLKMTSFQIVPPSPKIALGLIKTGDDVTVRFDWLVAATRVSSTQKQGKMVPLILDLPATAFKHIPQGLQLGSKVEPLSETPRPSMMVPEGTTNIAAGSILTSSDRNITDSLLSKLTDGRKEASDDSIFTLRKGRQWVQMDLGSPQEIFAILIWHSHNSAKIYHDVVVQVADDSDFLENVRTVFNNDQDNTSGLGVGSDLEYFETYEGKLIDTKGEGGRYIRFYSKGSTESALNEYTEIEVYGMQAQ